MALSQPWLQFPPQFLEELNEIIPSETLPHVLEALSLSRQPSFRVNTLKCSLDDAFSELETEGIAYQKVSWCEEAFVVSSPEKEKVAQLTLFKNGSLYAQSLSSILATIVLDPKPREEILDLCASPGSKTSHIAARMQNTGAILANDSSKNRMYKLQHNLQMLGVLNAKETCQPGEWMWKTYPNVFDRVLVDVPCSMEGRFVATEPDTYKDWKPAKGKLLSQKQKYLLRSAVACTKQGGTIIYSTCTLNPRENEEVIDWILEKEGGHVELVPIEVSGVELERGLTSWKKKIFNEEVAKTVRILPSLTMEGFFLAKLRRI